MIQVNNLVQVLLHRKTLRTAITTGINLWCVQANSAGGDEVVLDDQEFGNTEVKSGLSDGIYNQVEDGLNKDTKIKVQKQI